MYTNFMYDLISIGSISIDLFFQGDSLTLKDNRFQLAVGGKYVADRFHESLGGGGANMAIGARKHGLKTAVSGKIGNNPFKRIILQKLIENDIDYSLCDFEDSYYNISSILLTATGERSIVHYMTPHQHIITNKNQLKEITKTRMVYLGNLADVSLTDRIALLKFFKDHKITTIVNLGVKDCRRQVSQLKQLLEKTDILIINGHEFAEMVKAPYKDIHFKEQVIKWYIPLLINKLVVITEGKKGSYAYLHDTIYHQPAVKIEKIIDTTGAGDAYTSGFISEYFKSANIQLAMEKGTHYASKILQRIGAN